MARLIGHGYRKVVRPILFLQDPEKVHDRTLRLARNVGKVKPLRRVVRASFAYHSPKLHQKICGIDFANPVGLAGGYDKNAQLTDFMPSLGFGFMEVGSITGRAARGNTGKRLVRLKKSKAVLVNFGLNNDGAKAISRRLRHKKFAIPIGTNIAKTNSKLTASDQAGVDDYVKGFKAFTQIGAFYTINISCPNAYGGQPFHDAKRLERLLSALDKVESPKPRFLKIAPDMTDQQVDDIIKVVKNHRVDGFVCSNLTKKRQNPKLIETQVPDWGGISGKVVEELANHQIAHIYKATRGKYKIIGCGGIFSAEDAYKKIRLGASLVELITGMIYQGPQLIGEINKGLAELIERDGFSNISQAVGKDI